MKMKSVPSFLKHIDTKVSHKDGVYDVYTNPTLKRTIKCRSTLHLDGFGLEEFECEDGVISLCMDKRSYVNAINEDFSIFSYQKKGGKYIDSYKKVEDFILQEGISREHITNK